MGQASPEIKVFVSSTSEDMAHFRAAAKEVILGLGWTPRMMEYFGAGPQETVRTCREQVAGCQLVLLIIAFRRGWVPSAEQGGNGVDPVTAIELAHARTLGIPILAMLASDETWPGKLWEDDAEARAWVNKFRAELNLPAVFFDHEQPTVGGKEPLPVFRAKVREVLLAHQGRLLAQRAPRDEGADISSDAARGLQHGELIPFIGTGIYGDGPLSAVALARALSEANGGSDLTLASAAEYREGKERSRGNFLAKLLDVIDQQQREVEPPATYPLLAKLETATLIVSTTLDQLLEQELAAAGRPFVVVSHVLYSCDGEHDGRILLRRETGEVEICPGDQLDVSNAPCIVYKLLGSPFHYDMDIHAEPDTVVITESDHLLFLRRLANRCTSVPPSLARAFKRRPLLFLGYSLDRWHYRLVLQLCEAVCKASRPIAVRIPTSIVEEEAWRRLRADLIRIDPNVFAGRTATELAAL